MFLATSQCCFGCTNVPGGPDQRCAAMLVERRCGEAAARLEFASRHELLRRPDRLLVPHQQRLDGLATRLQVAIETGTNARISFAFSNRARGEAEGSDEYFALVDGYGIPLITHSSTEFRKQTGGRFSDHREEFDQQVTDKLAQQDA